MGTTISFYEYSDNKFKLVLFMLTKSKDLVNIYL
jgi:hypothetical protein